MVDQEQLELDGIFLTVLPNADLETGSLGTVIIRRKCNDCSFTTYYLGIGGDPRWGEDEPSTVASILDQVIQGTLNIAVAKNWGDIVSGAFNRLNSDNSRGRTRSGVSMDLLVRVDPELEDKFPIRFEP